MIVDISNSVYIFFILLISHAFAKTICPFDSSRYLSKDYVLAVEDYPFGVLTADIFEGVNGAVPKLKSLILRNDSVHTVFPDTFLSLPKLACLDLSRNKMRSLSEAMFRGLRGLDTLILSNNIVKELEDSEFVSVGNLKVLDLADNAIESISGAAFRGLVHLEELSLEGNNLRTLPPLLFYHTPNLKSLKLRNNKLGELDVSMLAQLSFLDISGAALPSFPTLPDSVQVLNLTGNQLVELPVRSGYRLSKLKEVYLGGNEWICSCDTVEWAMVWANKSIVGGIFDVKCQNPEYLRGESLGPALAGLDCQFATTNSETDEGGTLNYVDFLPPEMETVGVSPVREEVVPFLPSLPSTTPPPSSSPNTAFNPDWNSVDDFVQYLDLTSPSPRSRTYHSSTSPPPTTAAKWTESETRTEGDPPSLPPSSTPFTGRIQIIPTELEPSISTSPTRIRLKIMELLQSSGLRTTDLMTSTTSAPPPTPPSSSPPLPPVEQHQIHQEKTAINHLTGKEVGGRSRNESGEEGKGVGGPVPPVSLLNAITILIALAFGLGLCLIFMVVFMIMHKVKSRRSHEFVERKGGERMGLYGAPMFSVSPLHSDIIMRSTYGRAEGMRVVQERGVHPSLHPTPLSYTPHAFHSMDMEEEMAQDRLAQEPSSSNSESPPQSISLSEHRPLWSHDGPSTSIQI